MCMETIGVTAVGVQGFIGFLGTCGGGAQGLGFRGGGHNFLGSACVVIAPSCTNWDPARDRMEVSIKCVVITNSG